MRRLFPVAAAMASAALALSGCGPSDGGDATAAEARTVAVTVGDGADAATFTAELADTPERQQQGLMYRPALANDRAMLFAPMPLREASFWMRNTPASLDIVFIRPDGTIARIAENTVPFSEEQVRSGEPVDAVLEIAGGRAAELGLEEGDPVRWPGRDAG